MNSNRITFTSHQAHHVPTVTKPAKEEKGRITLIFRDALPFILLDVLAVGIASFLYCVQRGVMVWKMFRRKIETHVPRTFPDAWLVGGMNTRELNWTKRFFATSLYLGFAPIAWMLRIHKKSAFYAHHTKHALALDLLSFLCCIVIVALEILDTIIGIYNFELYKWIPIELFQLILFGLLLVLFLRSLWFALKGRKKDIVFLSKIARHKLAPCLAVLCWLCVIVFLMALPLLVIHSRELVQNDAEHAEVFMLYDDMQVYPRWFFTLGFYPVSLKANAISGPRSTFVGKLTQDSLEYAFAHGEFIVLATHGSPGKIYAGGEIFRADEAKEASSGHIPDFLYLAGCSIAHQDDSWKRAFPTSKLIVYERTSWVIEHVAWLYLKGPSELEQTLTVPLAKTDFSNQPEHY